MAPRNTFLFLFSLFLLHEVVHTQLEPSKVEQVFESLLNGTNVSTVLQNFRFIDASPDDVHFVLFLPSNETKMITSEDAAAVLNPDNPTIVLFHGWIASVNSTWVVEMASLYHQKGGYNVIAVDWGKDAAENYLHAVFVSQSIGNITGEFLLNITETNPDFLKNVHLIAHSLGAQIAGFTGKRVANSGQKIDRITGLDPAAPFFEIPVKNPDSHRLGSNDASFLDVYHTNKYLYGVAEAYGTVDFYVNDGGPIQPGCENIDLHEAISCSHAWAHEVYAKTILEPERYEAVACISDFYYDLGFCDGNSKAFLGEGVSRQASGTYYVNIDPSNK